MTKRATNRPPDRAIRRNAARAAGALPHWRKFARVKNKATGAGIVVLPNFQGLKK